MFKKILVLLILSFTLTTVFSWGFYAHKKINRLAVFTLPKTMIGFYKSHINEITEHAVDPDKRRYADSLEAPRHFLDADHFGENPFDSIPRKWKDAVKKYPKDTLTKYGIVPWHIEKTYYNLVKAFEMRDSAKILKYSADIGHYIADAHVPLHTSVNYNGQLTNQVGLHAFWESRLPELFADDYDFFVGRATYIEQPLDKAWQILENTFSMLDSTLRIEKELSSKFESDAKYDFSERDGKVIRNYSLAYSKAYHEALNGMVERQMRKAIFHTGCYWYSAWVDAGQPELKNLRKEDQTEEEKKQIALEEKQYKSGKIIGRDENP